MEVTTPIPLIALLDIRMDLDLDTEEEGFPSILGLVMAILVVIIMAGDTIMEDATGARDIIITDALEGTAEKSSFMSWQK